MATSLWACGAENVAQTTEARSSFQGLVLKAAEKVSVTLFSEFEEGKTITPTDGKLPIYRYIHDLNAEGFIDYK